MGTPSDVMEAVAAGDAERVAALVTEDPSLAMARGDEERLPIRSNERLTAQRLPGQHADQPEVAEAGGPHQRSPTACL